MPHPCITIAYPGSALGFWTRGGLILGKRKHPADEITSGLREKKRGDRPIGFREPSLSRKRAEYGVLDIAQSHAPGTTVPEFCRRRVPQRPCVWKKEIAVPDLGRPVARLTYTNEKTSGGGNGIRTHEPVISRLSA